ncbi:MAG: hypothetical protein KBT20_07405 [Bacteroidales bacterium]|nr:hypothetical protein [Candidatus Liminaster caballi]
MTVLTSVQTVSAAALTEDVKADAKRQKALQDSLKTWMKEARFNTNDKAKPNFARARAALRKAFANPYGQNNADVLLQAAATEYQCFQTERNKPAAGQKMDEQVIYTSTADGFSYYCKAYESFKHHAGSMSRKKEPSAKEYAMMQNNAYDLFRITKGFRATAGYYSSKSNWTKAYEIFDLACHAIDCELLTDLAASNPQVAADFEKFRTDSLRSALCYNRAIAAVMLGNHTLSIKELTAARNCGVETNRIYQQLCKEYLALNDSAGYIRTLQEGMTVLPEEPWFSQNLLNIYLSNSQHQAALDIIDQVIRVTPGNAKNIELKARLLDESDRDEEAEAAYLQALAIDSTLYVSHINLGRLYYNKATARENELIDQRRFDDVYDEVVPLYEAALPYYYHAYEMDVKRQDTSIPTAIRTILFKRFQSPKCPNAKELIKKYNEVSRAYGWRTL